MGAEEAYAAFDRALQRAAEPVNNYAAGLTAMSVGDKHRREQLADVQSQRDYFDSAAELASQRRMRELTESERQRLVQKYAELGVPVTAKDSIEAANGKYRQFQSDRADNLLTHFDSRLSDVADQKKSTIEAIQQLARKQADPQTAREALTITLSNPAAVKDIPAAQLTKLKAVLNGPGDPKEVVQKVYDYMTNDYWVRKEAAQTKASAFYQTYLTELNSRLDKTKQIDAGLLMNQLNDADKTGFELVAQRDRHVTDFAPFLSKDRIAASHKAQSITPPANPADAFGKDFEPGAGGEMPTTATAAGVNVPPATGSTGPDVGDAMEQGGIYAAVPAMRGKAAAVNARMKTAQQNFADRFINQPASDTLQGLFSRDPGNAPAPSAADVLANRAAVDQRTQQSIPAHPGDQLVQAIHAIARENGVSDEEIAKADAAMRNGTATPQMISGYKLFLNLAKQRMGGGGMNLPPGSTGPGSMPIQDPDMAPMME